MPLEYDPYPKLPDAVFIDDDLRPEDIICSGSEGEDENPQQTNDRIRTLAERYLQGEPLYIHTAYLRGPFVNNPWKKLRKPKKKGTNGTASKSATAGSLTPAGGPSIAASGSRRLKDDKVSSYFTSRRKIASMQKQATAEGKEELSKRRDDRTQYVGPGPETPCFPRRAVSEIISRPVALKGRSPASSSQTMSASTTIYGKDHRWSCHSSPPTGVEVAVRWLKSPKEASPKPDPAVTEASKSEGIDPTTPENVEITSAVTRVSEPTVENSPSEKPHNEKGRLPSPRHHVEPEMPSIRYVRKRRSTRPTIDSADRHHPELPLEDEALPRQEGNKRLRVDFSANSPTVVVRDLPERWQPMETASVDGGAAHGGATASRDEQPGVPEPAESSCDAQDSKTLEGDVQDIFTGVVQDFINRSTRQDTSGAECAGSKESSASPIMAKLPLSDGIVDSRINRRPADNHEGDNVFGDRRPGTSDKRKQPEQTAPSAPSPQIPSPRPALESPMPNTQAQVFAAQQGFWEALKDSPIRIESPNEPKTSGPHSASMTPANRISTSFLAQTPTQPDPATAKKSAVEDTPWNKILRTPIPQTNPIRSPSNARMVPPPRPPSPHSSTKITNGAKVPDLVPFAAFNSPPSCPPASHQAVHASRLHDTAATPIPSRVLPAQKASKKLVAFALDGDMAGLDSDTTLSSIYPSPDGARIGMGQQGADQLLEEGDEDEVSIKEIASYMDEWEIDSDLRRMSRNNTESAPGSMANSAAGPRYARSYKRS